MTQDEQLDRLIVEIEAQNETVRELRQLVAKAMTRLQTPRAAEVST